MLLVCDHAGRAVPGELGALGLPPERFEEHIAYDIGAATVARLLSEALGATALLAGYSRLLIDVNRPPGHPQSVPEVSDGVPIPANHGLSEADLVAREEAVFWPYHHAIAEHLARLWRHGPPPVLISVHSFTPAMGTCVKPRPWHIGVMWNRDPRLAVPMIRNLEKEPGLAVGDNEPYSGREVGYTVDFHAASAGLAHVTFEIRQDLVADPRGREDWAHRLEKALRFVLAESSEVHRVVQY